MSGLMVCIQLPVIHLAYTYIWNAEYL